jgi:hypothetical protein
MQTIQNLFFLAPMFLTIAVLGFVALYAVLGDLVSTLSPEATEEQSQAEQTTFALIFDHAILGALMVAEQIAPMPCIQVKGSNVPKGYGSGQAWL